ncbi:MAG: hypothetical protein OWT28_06165 [Firmicutes bacterium]|nr:hypothetical protein [Bacillota bacterium]
MATKRTHHRSHGTTCYKKCEEIYELDRAIRKLDEAQKELRKAQKLVVAVRDQIAR